MKKPFKNKEKLGISRPTGLHRFCVAPMMDWSDRHCRYLWRLISKHTFLYTEMVTTGALLHGEAERFLNFNEAEHPVALQLGGSDPDELARCAQLAEQWGYDEVNLNCGCPSDRVQSGRFGACLMAEPELVARCFAAMQETVSIPVTIKHRIGIDDQDEYEDLTCFVTTLADVGCKTFIVHARKAWLRGLSPKQNRDIPPLNYQRVYQLKRDFSELEIIINGGVTELDSAQVHLQHVDGVMIGREAYHNPYLLADVDSLFFGRLEGTTDRHTIVEHYRDYCDRQLQRGTRMQNLSRHVLGIFQGQVGARKFRRYISENNQAQDADVLLRAIEAM